VFETEEFLKKFGKLAADQSRRLRKKLDEYVYPQLRCEPFCGLNIKKLRGYNPEVWRCRIGRFRVFYTVDTNEGVIYVPSVDLRRDAYKT